MPSSVWKGFISFGLVSLPVRLYAAARTTRINLHQLHRTDHVRLRQPLYCPQEGRIVDRGEVVKGYEYQPGKYVLIDPQDLQKIQPQSAKTMEILSFADTSEIDPLVFDASYFVVPESAGRKAYLLLERTLDETHRVGIAKLTMHQREYIVFIRPYHHGLTLHTMYFANEIRQAPGYGETDHVKLAPQEVKLAEQLVAHLSEPFHLEKYHDEYQERLKALIEARQNGEEIAAARQPKRAAVIDIMSALKKSLAASGKSTSGRTASKPGPVGVATVSGRRRGAHRKAS